MKKLSKDQRKLVKGLYGKGDFFEVDETYYFKTDDGNTYKLDFDNQNLNKKEQEYKSTVVSVPPENEKNIEIESENRTEDMSEDLTVQQVEENYWVETDLTKMDSSTAMMEARTSKCQEATGRTRESCSEEVKSRMKKNGSENTNTDNIDKVEETVDNKDKEVKKVEICGKEYDMLLGKAKEFDALKADKDGLSKDLIELRDDLKAIKDGIEAKEASEKESKRQELIKKISTDFVFPAEELAEDTLEELQKLEKRLDMAVKKPNEETDEEPSEEDFAEGLESLDNRAKALSEEYICKA